MRGPAQAGPRTVPGHESEVSVPFSVLSNARSNPDAGSISTPSSRIRTLPAR